MTTASFRAENWRFLPERRDLFAFLPYGQKLKFGSVKPSLATLIRAAFNLSRLAFKRKMQGWHQAIPAFLVQVYLEFRRSGKFDFCTHPHCGP